MEGHNLTTFVPLGIVGMDFILTLLVGKFVCINNYFPRKKLEGSMFHVTYLNTQKGVQKS